MNRSVKSEHSCILPDLRGKAFNTLPLSVLLTVEFHIQQAPFSSLRAEFCSCRQSHAEKYHNTLEIWLQVFQGQVCCVSSIFLLHKAIHQSADMCTSRYQVIIIVKFTFAYLANIFYYVFKLCNILCPAQESDNCRKQLFKNINSEKSSGSVCIITKKYIQ